MPLSWSGAVIAQVDWVVFQAKAEFEQDGSVGGGGEGSMQHQRGREEGKRCS